MITTITSRMIQKLIRDAGCFAFFCFSLSLFFTQNINGQSLEVYGATGAVFTPQSLIQNVFLGEGVEVTNITYSGTNGAVGYFNGGQSAVGIERGIVLTTGNVESNLPNTVGCAENGSFFASTSNNSTATDANLSAIVSPLYDVAVYTITFIPTSDTLRFRYCFASEEYPEFSCSPYNDVFGFFIQGPNYPSPTNIAIIPNTVLPVTINNLHPFNAAYPNCNPTNAQYYNSNLNSQQQPTYDGFTDVFTAQAIVIPCQQYTIKLAIADVGDHVYDSGVFLEAKSFGTGSLRTEVATVSLDGQLTEGCAGGTVTFSLPTPATADFPIDYNIWGTATNGVDYAAVSQNLFIPAGQTELVLHIDPIEDGIVEGVETIAIDVQRDPCNRDTVYLRIRENGLKPPQLQPDTVVCSGTPLSFDATLPIPVPSPLVFTNTQDYSIAPTGTAIISPINVTGVVPLNLGPGMLISVCMNIDHSWVDDLDIFLISPGGQFLDLTTDNGADGNNYTGTCFTPSATTAISFPGPQAPASAAPFTGDFAPEGDFSYLFGTNSPVNGVWQLKLIDDTNGFVGTLRDWTITFEPSYRVDYAWTPTAGLSCPTCPVTDAIPTTTSNYTVVATDSYGCTVSDTVKVDVIPVLPAPVITCGNSSNSSVTFLWDTIQGSLGYEININNTGWINPMFDTAHTVTGLAPSSIVNIEVRGINPMTACGAMTSTAVCVNCEPPVVSHSEVDVSCFGATDGSVTFIPDNLNPPYTFRVGVESNSTGFFNNLAAGNYIGTVTDNSGCDTLIPFNIPSPAQIQPSVTVQQTVSCFGGNDGALSAVATGGSGVFQYTWSNGSTGSAVTGLNAGNFAVTIVDQNNCSVTAFGNVTEPAQLTAAATSQPAKCNGEPSGALSGTGGGGTSPYTFLWSTGETNANPTSMVPGSYVLTVTDNKGCTATTVATVGQPALLTASSSGTPATCSDRTDGTATATPTGGTGAYTYVWSDPLSQVTATAGNLAPGIYTVTITDVNGCVHTTTVSITSPPALVLNISQLPVSCSGGTNGSATVAPSGGNGGYQYVWSTSAPQSTATASNLSFGVYSVTVTDSKNCTAVTSITVEQSSALLVSTTSQQNSCFGSSDGVAKVNVTGGNQPYNYAWNSGENLPTITNISAGTYTVTITDSNNCTVTATATVTQPDQIVVSITPTPVLCHNGFSGAITTSISGGSGNFTYYWFGPDNFFTDDLTFDSIYAGNYTITVTDGNNCTTVESTIIYEPEEPLLLSAPYVSDTICFEATDGVARIYAQGGTTPYTFQWDDPAAQSTQFATNLPVELYHVTVTDANGCYQTDSTFVFQKAPLFVYVTPHPPRCHGGDDGFASIDFVSYGSDPYDPNLISYVWSTSPAQTSRVATGLLANTTYTVFATDEDGCTTTQVAPIPDQAPIYGFFTDVRNVNCFGGNDGQVQVNGTGGNVPYSYFWSANVGSQTAQMAENLQAGMYRVTITDSLTCQIIEEIEILQPTEIRPEVQAVSVPCFGETTGQVIASAEGGVLPYSYVWNSGHSTATISGVGAGMYSVSVIDNNGCIKLDSAEVRQPDAPLGASALEQAVACFGGSDGRITLSGNGGTPPYQYNLNSQPYNGSPIQISLRAGNYTPHIKDANGCIFTLPDVTVGQPDAIQIDLAPEITVVLGQNTQILADVLNAHEPYSVRWTPASDSIYLSCLDCLEPFVDSLYFAHTFYVEVIDTLGCRGEASVNLIVDKPRRIYVPTGFTPNEDLTNDLLLVHGQESAKILDFKVFDRWGELVYRTGNFRPNDAAFGWDGAFRGSPAPPDVYVWVLEVEYLDGEKEVLYGQTTLIR